MGQVLVFNTRESRPVCPPSPGLVSPWVTVSCVSGCTTKSGIAFIHGITQTSPTWTKIYGSLLVISCWLLHLLLVLMCQYYYTFYVAFCWSVLKCFIFSFGFDVLLVISNAFGECPHARSCYSCHPGTASCSSSLKIGRRFIHFLGICQRRSHVASGVISSTLYLKDNVKSYQKCLVYFLITFCLTYEIIDVQILNYVEATVIG